MWHSGLPLHDTPSPLCPLGPSPSPLSPPALLLPSLLDDGPHFLLLPLLLIPAPRPSFQLPAHLLLQLPLPVHLLLFSPSLCLPPLSSLAIQLKSASRWKIAPWVVLPMGRWQWLAYLSVVVHVTSGAWEKLTQYGLLIGLNTTKSVLNQW